MDTPKPGTSGDPLPIKGIRDDIRAIVDWVKSQDPNISVHVLNCIPRPARGQVYADRMVKLNRCLGHGHHGVGKPGGIPGAEVHRFNR